MTSIIVTPQSAKSLRWSAVRKERDRSRNEQDNSKKAFNLRLRLTVSEKQRFEAAGGSYWFRRLVCGLEGIPEGLPPLEQGDGELVNASLLISPHLCALYDSLGGVNWLRRVLSDQHECTPKHMIDVLMQKCTSDYGLERKAVEKFVKAQFHDDIPDLLLAFLVERVFVQRIEPVARQWLSEMDRDWRLWMFCSQAMYRPNASITAHKRNLESDLLRFCQEKGIEGIPNMDGLPEFLYFRNQELFRTLRYWAEHPECYMRLLRRIGQVFVSKSVPPFSRNLLTQFSKMSGEKLLEDDPLAPSAFAVELFMQMRGGLLFVRA